MTANQPTQAKGKWSPTRAWARALELTAPIVRNPERILPMAIADRARVLGDAPALLSDWECLTYRELTERANRYARWGLAQGLAKGDCVGLLMRNRPEYLTIWLGITQIGAVVALLNTNLTGSSLAHSIRAVAPKHLIVEAELLDALSTALPEISEPPIVWSHGISRDSCPRLDLEIEGFPTEVLSDTEHVRPTIADPALYIYTSGTTGLPKAACVSHGRLMQWSHWFAGLMGAGPEDRMYDCLPMYHSVGGVQAPGALLTSGGSVVLTEKFSARRFWFDQTRWDCTIFQYIGELCRYLLHTEPALEETQHRIRMACGNGLRPDVWADFKKRFRIPRILEFYAATEGNVSLFNVEEETGAIGRIPSFLAHRFSATLVKFDVETGEPVRNQQGFCIPCAANETGEAIGKIARDGSSVSGRFEGYTSHEASEKKILHNAFELGDEWFRTGDLMRKDERGFFYFVDRMGDTFRWKGENVATSEVAEAICAFPGIKEAIVYGVTIPGADGRAGMATLVTEGEIELAAFRAHLIRCLPEYARPLFLRIRREIELTGTLKYTRTELVQDAYDPAATTDPIYFNDPKCGAFLLLDCALHERIRKGQMTHRESATGSLESSVPAETSLAAPSDPKPAATKGSEADGV